MSLLNQVELTNSASQYLSQMRILFFCCLLAHLAFAANAQTGCTDPTASNYDPAATENDGSCIYPFTHVNPTKRATLDTAVTESSGLVFSDGMLWTHNDSGHPAALFAIDTATGGIAQTVYIDNYPNTDWEDITTDSAYIYIADVGNNNGDRHDLKILKIAKADIGKAMVVHVNASAINISYTDQTNFTSNPLTNYDCEAIISLRDSLYLFTKDRGDNQTRAYHVTKAPGTYALSPYTGYNVGGLVTGATCNAQTGEIVLIGYSLLRTNSFLMLLNDYKSDLYFSGNKRKIDINNGSEWQTEAVTWMPGNRLWLSCETDAGIPAALYSLGRVWAPSASAVVGASKNAVQKLFPNPARDVLHVMASTASGFQILNVAGQVVREGKLAIGINTIAIDALPAGSYMLMQNNCIAAVFVKE